MVEHTVERRIAWGDLDRLGIVFYPRYYEWIDAASHCFFEAAGLDQNALLSGRGLIFGLVETGCRYRHPGRYHQRIRITTRLASLGTRTVTLKHTIRRADNGETMVEGHEKRICLAAEDPRAMRAVSIPDDIRDLLNPESRP
jgi:YbgC/YbaW family acyl-CoA thioester hydrolase